MSTFASLKDICHLQNAELEQKLQKYKGRVVLRGDIITDDSGASAVITEQGSSVPDECCQFSWFIDVNPRPAL